MTCLLSKYFPDCVKYRDSIAFCGDGSRLLGRRKNVNVVRLIELEEDLIRITVNMEFLPSRVVARAEKMKPKCDLGFMEITMTKAELEIIINWLIRVSTGKDKAEIPPAVVLLWPSADYGWTRAALKRRSR